MKRNRDAEVRLGWGPALEGEKEAKRQVKK